MDVPLILGAIAKNDTSIILMKCEFIYYLIVLGGIWFVVTC